MTGPDDRELDFGQLDQTIAILKIGPEQRLFNVHKGVLCKWSPYFRAPFSENWKEGRENSITLDEADPEAYDDDILRTKVYIFADRYDIPQLRQNVLSWSYCEYYHTIDGAYALPAYNVIALVFDNLPSSSKLCEFYVDLYASRWDPTYDYVQDVKARKKLPTSFLQQLVTRMGQRRKHNLQKELEQYFEKVNDGEDQLAEETVC